MRDRTLSDPQNPEQWSKQLVERHMMTKGTQCEYVRIIALNFALIVCESPHNFSGQDLFSNKHGLGRANGSLVCGGSCLSNRFTTHQPT